MMATGPAVQTRRSKFTASLLSKGTVDTHACRPLEHFAEAWPIKRLPEGIAKKGPV